MNMKKTILLAIALFLLLFATAFAGNLGNKVTGQKVIVSCSIFEYGTGQRGNTRANFRNIDPNNAIQVISVKYYDPDGNVVIFDQSTDPYTELLEDPIDLGSFDSDSFRVSRVMLEDASWNITIPPTFGGGTPFYLIEWVSLSNPVVPPEIWGGSWSIYGGRKGEDKYRIRYSFDRWEGVVVSEVP
jgi:hypothetical protein